MRRATIFCSLALIIGSASAISRNPKTGIGFEGEIKQIVINNALTPRSDKAWTSLSFKEDLVIGDHDENSFGNIRTLRVDRRGRIYALDSRLARISVFDFDGRKMLDIGKKGKGPGEWIVPWEMHLASNDLIFVYDPGNARISYFSLQGEFLSEANAGKLMPIIRMIPSETGNIVVQKSAVDEGKYLYEIAVYNKQLEKIRILEKLEEKYDKNVFEFYSPGLRYCVFGNRVIWGVDSKYQIKIGENDGDGEMWVINKEYKAVSIPVEDKKKEIDEIKKGRDPKIEKKYVFPNEYPAYDHFGVSDEGILFVRTFQKNQDGQFCYDFFDPSGNYVFSKYLGFSITVWKNGKVYSIEENAGGFQIIKRYQVTISGRK